MKNNKFSRVGSEEQYGPRLVGGILHDYLENSNEPLAVAYRKHKSDTKTECDTSRLFSDVYPHTEVAVDLKLITCQPGRMRMGTYLDGMITRDGAEHFCFVQNDPVKRKTAKNHRNPRVYTGRYINVIRQDDGTMYPTFNRPRYTESFTFRDFCREAAEELILVSGLVGEE